MGVDVALRFLINIGEALELADLSGQYFGDRKTIPAPARALDPEANCRLWQISEALSAPPSRERQAADNLLPASLPG